MPSPGQFPYPRQVGPTAQQFAKGSHVHTAKDIVDLAVGTSVTSFNSRTGAVTLLKSDVTGTGLSYPDVGAAASVHTHAEADVASLTADLAARLVASSNLSDVANATTARTNLGAAALVHTHAEADVTSLTTDLAGKAALSHTHAESDVTNLPTDLAGRAFGYKGGFNNVPSATPSTNSSSTSYIMASGLTDTGPITLVSGRRYKFTLTITWANSAAGQSISLRVAGSTTGAPTSAQVVGTLDDFRVPPPDAASTFQSTFVETQLAGTDFPAGTYHFGIAFRALGTGTATCGATNTGSSLIIEDIGNV